MNIHLSTFGLGAATQLALQLQQERIQVVRSNKVVRGLPIDSFFLILFFVFCLRPKNPHMTSYLGLEVNPLGVYPLG